ncbi:MAG TPA: hypothetical protein VIJ14_08590 [Rhabdochlamydiaceae bacterium]
MENFIDSFISKTGSLTRLQYLGRSLMLTLAVVLISFVPIIGLVGIGSLYPAHFLIQQRLRNMGYNCSTKATIGWQILLLIPLISIIPGILLLFTPPFFKEFL